MESYFFWQKPGPTRQNQLFQGLGLIYHVQQLCVSRCYTSCYTRRRLFTRPIQWPLLRSYNLWSPNE